MADEPDFAKGASGPDPYAAGLGIAAPYLGGASASASASGSGSGSAGWTAVTGTFAYSSADGPTFVASTPTDQSGTFGVGSRVKLTQTTDKYFIVTAIDATTVTLYGGTDYTLANATITAFYYSQLKAPLGFPLSPAKWTEQLKDTTLRTQATPVNGTWYNPGSLSLSVPIGCWRLTYAAVAQSDQGVGTGAADAYTTLSTANNSESDVDFTAYSGETASIAANDFRATQGREKIVVLAAKASYYLNVKSGASVSEIRLMNATAPAIIRAWCEYL